MNTSEHWARHAPLSIAESLIALADAHKFAYLLVTGRNFRTGAADAFSSHQRDQLCIIISRGESRANVLKKMLVEFTMSLSD